MPILKRIEGGLGCRKTDCNHMAVRTHHDGVNLSGRAQGAHQPTGGSFVDLQGLILVPGEPKFAVGGESHPIQHTVLSVYFLEFLACDRVPPADKIKSVVPGVRNDPLSIRAECYTKS